MGNKFDRISKSRPLIVDFIGGALNHRLNFGGGIGQDLAKAVGIKSGIRPEIIDATAGLGRDSFIMASLGSKITLIERSQIMHDLLADGMKKASNAGGRTSEIISRMRLIYGDAIELIPQMSTDVIYIDPMHPLRQKSALVKLEMRQIRSLVGEDIDQIELLEFDDVSNDQRQVIYNQRNEILEADSIRDVITHIRRDVVNDIYSGFIPPQSMEEQWDIDGLQQYIENEFNTPAPIQDWLDTDSSLHEETLKDKVISVVQQTYDDKCERLSDSLVEIEKQVMLQVLDMQWKDHLLNMDHLRQGIGLRAYAQKNPKQEYKRESFELFQSMLQTIKEETIRIVARVEPVSEEQMAAMEAERRRKMEAEMKMVHADSAQLTSGNEEPEKDENTFVRQDKKVGRNEPCPCGSGKKYKQCHGKL